MLLLDSLPQNLLQINEGGYEEDKNKVEFV